MDEGKALLSARTGDAVPASSIDLKWSEGLALGNQAFLAEWAAAYGTADAFSSLTTRGNGTTTASRAAANGTVTGQLVEAAYFFQAWSLDATDLMNFLITSDGATHLREAIWGTDRLSYKAVSMGVQVQG